MLYVNLCSRQEKITNISNISKCNDYIYINAIIVGFYIKTIKQ